MDLSFFEPPSPEQIMELAQAHEAKTQPFRIEAWPEPVRALAGSMLLHPLDDTSCDALISARLGLEGEPGPLSPEQTEKELQRLAMDLDEAWASLPFQKAFVRLGSRSPKDNMEHLDDTFRLKSVHNGRQALNVLAGSMERVLEDLMRARRLNQTAYLVLRPYQSIAPEREFRLFIENRRLIGMSQYAYQESFPALLEEQETIDKALRSFVEAQLQEFPWNSFTLDVWQDEAGQIHFLEANPPVTSGLTDPCLFRDGAFQGQLRLGSIEAYPGQSLRPGQAFTLDEGGN